MSFLDSFVFVGREVSRKLIDSFVLTISKADILTAQ
jgi:hypothetical protein